ncbi:SPOR domain-containing protein [Sphingomonas changnyeongensis]|uniref:SPOR domain-containing protein n=1 Tax=Sphingomonas changnyeongensis TaxID=2698679 RepID=A0A7Z2NTK1_9SPHN|nr:SPOR domain-containing protein [Sphingomonas changnyeongensis]QHL89585.1 SPOR domain-containing protein [Sphingomonas changnyeongensis]
MGDFDRDGYLLRDEDRLPWLEAVDDEDDLARPGPGRIAAMLLGAVVAVTAVLAGIWWWQSRPVSPSGAGELIAAPAGPYKVRPADPGGMEVEGKGEAAFQTSEGADPKGALDLTAVPEAPVTRAPAAPATPAARPPASTAAGPGAASASVAEGGRLTAKAPPAPASAPAGPAGSVIQLGAFDSQSVALSAWTGLSRRFAYLDGLNRFVVPAKVGGRTFYRLRATAPSADAARDACARLKVAGEACLVVN